MQRNFADLTSSLHEAIVARLPTDVVAELEADALACQTGRERQAAERRAAKAAAPLPPRPPRIRRPRRQPEALPPAPRGTLRGPMP
jgi:hypothetical protein